MPRINEETGEVIETGNNQLIAEQFTDEVLEMYAQYEYLKQQKEIFEYKLRKVCAENDIKSVDNDYFRITFIPAHTSTKVDIEKLKMAGYYDDFVKEVEVKESVRVKIK